MIQYIKYLAFIFAGLLLSPIAAFAHPGHDHAHWSSPAVHTVLFVSVSAVAFLVVAGFALKWKYKRGRKADSGAKQDS